MLLNYGLAMASPISSSTVSANSIDFTYLECGSGPLALCMHGFPDSAHSWRHLLPELADAGFHAVAPFMRGSWDNEINFNYLGFIFLIIINQEVLYIES
jgi:pimeloyl-ACP methyl ester carboxylesterase